MRVSISDIAYVTGDPIEIAQLPECSADPERLAALQAEGFSVYASSPADPYALAAQVARRIFAQSALAPEQVDILLFCSDSLEDQRRVENNRHIHSLCSELGLTRAYPLGVTQSSCGNLCSALRVASSLIVAGEVQTILLLTSDTHHGQRLLESDVAVLSDGAAGCLVHRDETRGYRIEGFSQHAVHRTAIEGKRADVALAEIVQGVDIAFSGLLARVGWRAQDVAALIPNNFGLTLLSLYAQVAEIDMARVYTANIGTNGHVYTADNLINLADRARAHGRIPGERLVLLSNGPSNFGFCALTGR